MQKPEKERKKKKIVPSAPSRPVIENSKKIAKKLKKFENTIIASFQTKIDWEILRKRENKKKNRSDEFLPDVE